MRTFDEAAVERALRAIDVPALMAATLRDRAEERAGGPTRAALRMPDGVWFAAMPAFVAAPFPAIGAKFVIAVPPERARGGPTHRATVVLFDAAGTPLATLDAEYLTRARTAAVSVVATRTLARRPVGAHAILGAGAQADAHLRAFADAGLVERCAIWSRDAARAERLVAVARALGINAVRAASAAAAVRAADTITTCTASAEPLFSADAVADGAHVNAVGACVPERREVPGALVGAATLVLDDLAAARSEAGDVILAVAEGAARWDGAVELGDVLAGRGRLRPGRATVFVSLGLGVEDVACAAAVLTPR